MMLRKASQLVVGDVVVLKHSRYEGHKFEVVKVFCVASNNTMGIRVVTQMIGSTFGPTLDCCTEDMIQIEP